MSAEITRPALSKAGRALRKFGLLSPTPKDKQAVIQHFLSLGIDPLKRKSSSLAQKLRFALETGSPFPKLESTLPAALPPFALKRPTAQAVLVLARALKIAGWADPSELLVAQAAGFLAAKGVKPLAHSAKTLANRLRGFQPAAIPAPPSRSRKFAELMILAASLGLEMVTLEAAKLESQAAKSEENETAKLEALLRTAAKTLPEPSNPYAREIALRYGIVFEGELFDCFGLWERDNFYCTRCPDQEACLTRVKQASLGALASPAMKEFKVPSDFERPSAPLRLLAVDKTSTEASVAAIGDRKMLLSWIQGEFPALVRVDYSESTNFQINHPYRKRLVVLKIERFTPRAYTVAFHAASPEQAEKLHLAKTRHGYFSATPDILRLQDAIRTYLKNVLDLPAMSIVLSREEEAKQRIQRRLVAEWTGRIEPRTGYELFLDTRNLRILRFNRFSAKGFMLDFSRWNEKAAAEHGLRHTGSGARYEGTDEEELNQLLNVYLHSIRSKYFSPRHPVAAAAAAAVTSPPRPPPPAAPPAPPAQQQQRAPLRFGESDRLDFPIRRYSELPKGEAKGKLFVNVVGANGSGKSRLGRFLALNDPLAYTFGGESGRVIGSVFPTFGWGCVGRYSTQYGGADELHKPEIMEAVYRLCATPLHIYLDGILVACAKETYWEVMLGVEKNFGRRSAIIMLDYPIETCLERMAARSNGSRPPRAEKVLSKWECLRKNSALWEERIAGGAPVALARENSDGVEPMLRSIRSALNRLAGEDVLPVLA